jgi:hypothetical protein
LSATRGALVFLSRDIAARIAVSLELGITKATRIAQNKGMGPRVSPVRSLRSSARAARRVQAKAALVGDTRGGRALRRRGNRGALRRLWSRRSLWSRGAVRTVTAIAKYVRRRRRHPADLASPSHSIHKFTLNATILFDARHATILFDARHAEGRDRKASSLPGGTMHTRGLHFCLE